MRLLFLSLLFAASNASAQTGTISGTVFEADGITGIIGANVRVGGTTLGAATDLDGNYRIADVPVGTYSVTASYVGDPTSSADGIIVGAGATRHLDFTMPQTAPGCIADWAESPMINTSPFASRIRYGDGINPPYRTGPCEGGWPATGVGG